MAEPRRHAAGMGDLTDREAGALGLLVNRLARALKDVAGAEHVYSFVLADGLAHLHIILAPRYASTPREYWGVRLREWPDAPALAKMRCGAWWLGSERICPPLEEDECPRTPGLRHGFSQHVADSTCAGSEGLKQPLRRPRLRHCPGRHEQRHRRSGCQRCRPRFRLPP